MLRAFKDGLNIEAVVMIGAIGDGQKIEAAAWEKDHLGKSLVCFIAGLTGSPPGGAWAMQVL